MRPFSPPRAPATVRLLLAALLVLLPSGTAMAQGLGALGSGSDPGAGTLVERDQVTAAARASFIEALVRRGDEVAQDRYDIALDVQAAQQRYERALSARLDRLQGDGLLTLAEVREDLPALRDEELAEFSDIVSARSRGYVPPPRREQHDAFWPFAKAMTRYTIITRNDLEEWLGLFGRIIAGLLVGSLANATLSRLTRRIDSSQHQGLYRAAIAMRLPLLLGAATLGAWLGFHALWKPTAVEWWVNGALATVLAGVVFWAVWNLCIPLSEQLSSLVQRITDADVGVNGRLVITHVLRLLAIVALVLVVTRVVIGASLGGILTGLGVVGVLLWFLMRGLIENLAASFTLFSDRSVNVNDTIIYDGQWGQIEGIGFRTTRFRTFDGFLITIPNTRMLGDEVVNVSSRPSVRRRFHLSIALDTPVDEIARTVSIIEQAIAARGDGIATEAGVNVVLDKFGPYDLQLLVQYYTATSDYWSAKHVHDAVNRDILAGLERAGIRIPFPTRTAILRSGDEPARIALSGNGEGDTDGQIDTGDTSDSDGGHGRDEAGGEAAPTGG